MGFNNDQEQEASIDDTADFVIIPSEDMITTIVEEHLNKTMKKKVRIVYSKITEQGYMFGITYVQVTSQPKKESTIDTFIKKEVQQAVNKWDGKVRDTAISDKSRDNNGRYKKVTST